MSESAGTRDDGMPFGGMDPTFYRSAAEAVAAPAEKLAYVVAFDCAGERPDALSVIDVKKSSDNFGTVVGWAELPTRGDELHHFGWNACSSALRHAGHDMGADGLQRRYLLLPGLRSSRIHVYDTQPDSRAPRLHKTIDATELAAKAGYSRPHTLHCGPDGIFLTCLGGPDGAEGPGGIALLDHSSFDVLCAWETDRGPQYLAYDAWWHLNQNTLITSEWGTPSMIENGLVPELLLGQKYGHQLHFWDLAAGRHRQTVDLGAEHQMVLELRPSHNPDATWGFVGVVISTVDLSASVWRWHRDETDWKADKVITIPAEPADPADLPPALQPFGAVPPLVSDIDLAVDDQMLYVSCWGTGELKQYDVSDPAAPREVGSVHLGGIVRRTAHPSAPSERLAGGAANGRGQPRRAAGLPHQLALRRLGRPVLPTGRRRLASEDRHESGVRWAHCRRALLPTRRRLPRSSSAPGTPARGRRLLRLLLLPRTAAAPSWSPTDNADRLPPPLPLQGRRQSPEQPRRSLQAPDRSPPHAGDRERPQFG